MSKVKTGHVFQLTVKGPNYIVLGTTSVEGSRKLVVTKNGNIRLDGKAKRAGLAPIVLYVVSPSKVKRVHQQRKVDLKSVFLKETRTVLPNNTVKRSNVGVESSAVVMPSEWLNA